MSSGIRLYPRHLRGSKTCHKNGRLWFAARGWSWAEFVAEGRPIEDFEATGCPLAQPAIAFAREEAENGR